ncbi:MAG TPA: chemotaxis protein CheD [Gemmatimonadales bacterium]|nr:chemotaxis protein CheD [Gemmatimonadales bacterium]
MSQEDRAARTTRQGLVRTTRPQDPLTGMEALPRRYLHAGEFITCGEPSMVITILGSCVGVALYDTRTGAGGLNHFLLPRSPATGGESSARYGDVAMPKLLDAMLGRGSLVRDLQAKVFGGARVLNYRDTPPHRDLGAGNFDLAFEFLESQSIRIAGRDVGGRHGRKLVFHTHLGDAWVKRL